MPTAYKIYAQPLMAKPIMARKVVPTESPDDSPYAVPAQEYNFLSGVLPPGLTYTNSSTTRAYWDAAGTRQAAAANVPIFETLGGVLQGMRWEMEQRTNLATNSEGAAATWSTASNVTDAGTSITGFSASLAFGDNSVGRTAYKTAVTVDATRYTISAFVQMDDGLAPVVGINATSGDFSLVIEGDVATLNATVQHIAGSLYRVSVGKVTVAPISNNNGILKYTTQSARTFRVAGIQLEAAASASSYIQTAAAAVTRQPDVLTATAITPWYNQSEGTVLFEGIVADVSVIRGIFGFSDATGDQRNSGYIAASAGTLVQLVNVSAVTQGQCVTANAVTAGSVFKSAFAYKANAFANTLNGGTVAVDNVGTVPTVDRLRLGDRFPTLLSPFMGYARRFQYYNTRLPNAQTQGMSRV